MKAFVHLSVCILYICIFSNFISCSNVPKESNTTLATNDSEKAIKVVDQDAQIAAYIRNIHQDQNGNYWFGTNGYGIAHYDGKSVSYFSNEQGFHGEQITGISEDLNHNIWFATDQGIVKLEWFNNQNGIKVFTNYTDSTFFDGNRMWSIYADRSEKVWAGSVNGVYVFDGKNWSSFEIPYVKKEGKEAFISKRTCWSITEDIEGNMWFATNGYGAFKYSGNSFTQISEIDGLSDNHIDNILIAKNGDVWFGTRFGGANQYNGYSFKSYTARDSIRDNEVCAILEDSKGNIWMSSEGFGVYRFDGTRFQNFGLEEGLGVRAVQAIFEDVYGQIWVGGGGGLYRFKDEKFINVKRNGPWKN